MRPFLPLRDTAMVEAVVRRASLRGGVGPHRRRTTERYAHSGCGPTAIVKRVLLSL